MHKENSRPVVRWTIARKIGGLSSVLLCFIITILIYSILTLQGIEAELKEIAKFDIPLSEITSAIETHQLEQHILMEQVFQQKHLKSQLKNKFIKLSTKLEQQIVLGTNLLKEAMKTDVKEEFKKIDKGFKKLSKEHNQYHQLFLKTIDVTNSPNFSQKKQKLELANTRLDQHAIALVKRVEKFTERAAIVTEQHSHAFFLVTTSLGIAAVLLGVLLSVAVIVSIKSNLFVLSKRIEQVSNAISNNEFVRSTPIEVDSTDEIASLANDLSSMLKNISKDHKKKEHLTKRWHKLATTDRLTGTLNRLKWDETVSIEMERAKRSHISLSLIIFDIDHFKSVNDNFGHDVGDKVLVDVAKVVQNNIRNVDFLFRIGGEEFVILTPCTNKSEARVIAEKIRQKIENHKFSCSRQITVSLGIAEFNKKEDEKQLVKKADTALYQAKNGGRNCTVVFEG